MQTDIKVTFQDKKDAERSYIIHAGKDIAGDITAYLPFDIQGRRLFVLSDENVDSPHAQAVCGALAQGRPDFLEKLILPPGEGSKSFAGLERVISWMLDHDVNRQSVLFAVGGGVIGDLGGLAASLVMRGIDYVQVPTTLLAQVDSAVGGKTAINMAQGKNLVGTFCQPRAVISDFTALTTLPAREIKAGYAEILKYGLLGDEEFFIWLEQHGAAVCALDEAALAKAVEISCRTKAAIVEQDEREGGVRALLNLGHTFGHALEAACGYDSRRILHGEAVAAGMVLAFQLSARLGLCDLDDAGRVAAHLKDIGLPTSISMIDLPESVTVSDLVQFMRHDKKIKDGKINFILARKIGEAFVTNDVDPADIDAVITHSFKGV